MYQGRSQDEAFYVTKDGQHIIRGVVYNLAKNPFQEDLDKLKTSGAPAFGPATAPVTLVEFGDFECPNCKEEAKTLRDNVPSQYPTQVRVVFKDFPLEQIHPWAKAAAIAGRCIYRQSPTAFWKYHDWIYDHQVEITPDNLKTQVLDFAKTASDVEGYNWAAASIPRPPRRKWMLLLPRAAHSTWMPPRPYLSTDAA